ncbi:cysteine peptidase family C39 domain-containing protein [Legionella spiritensis]|uniref:cysteine peptidase family C39 domain-containing protein n=1 Tax=Legionella spiritensis TaxID=452 RepID=UPI000F6BBAE7|nr:cysteine peptidase family C39 domain-containing protein [Legionella spiritensis]VEG89939.1 ABC-type bacteriocin/lantibiotic exporters, contain an N-terminal double-glycine peptidase domain [Legionella spiritensis]
MTTRILTKMRRVKTPVILQLEATECGSTALAILMAHYGKFVTAEEIRSICSVSRNGTTAINLVKAARHYGMSARGYNLEIDELDGVTLPFIVFWKFNHFLIVEGFSAKKVYLNDPAVGSCIVDWEEFEQGFTGVVLEIEPGEHFVPSGEPPSGTFHLLWQRIGHNQIAMLFISLVTLLLILPKTFIPLFIKVFVDDILTNHQNSLIPIIFGGIAMATFIEMLLTWIQKKSLLRLKIKLEMLYTVSFLWHLLHIPIRYFQQRSSGDIVERQEISEKISETLANDIPSALVNTIEIIAYMAVIMILSWPIGILLTLLIVMNFVALVLSKHYLTTLGQRYAQEQGKLYGIEMNGLQIIETIRIGALESIFFNRWLSHYINALQSEQQILWRKTMLGLFPSFINLLTILLVLCFGSYLVIIGQITVGTIIAIQGLAFLVIANLSGLVDFATTINDSRGDLIRLNDVLETTVDPHFTVKKAAGHDFLQKKSPVILKLDAITYSYSPLEPPVIDNLSLTVQRGQRIALVGASGSGKSTLAQLICGLNQVNSGQIFINDYLLSNLNRQELSEFIAYVDQNVFFFEGTLRDNLTFWNQEIADQDIHDLLKLVCLDEEIGSRGGLNMTVSEGGSNLSGGQCQRLEIVRALLHKPELLILDEATASLDLNTESIIYQNFIPLQRTLFIIAHRLHAIQNCDQILVLDKGHIAEAGSHQDLIKSQGIYYEQFRMEKL